MKKAYVKPQVYFENFQLSASIAGGCGDEYKNNLDVTSKDINSCGFYFAGKIVYAQNVCDRTPQEWETICYHIPNQDNRLFAS